MAKELWKQFEQRIRDEAPRFGITCWQIPTEIRLINKASQKIPIPIKSHPDFCAGINGLSAFFDAKSTQDKSWNLQDYVFRHDSRANKLHQWQKLEDAFEKGSVAGYLVWFVSLRVISWVSVECVRSLKEFGIKSVTPDCLGVVSIPDDQPINLKSFLGKDLERQVARLREAL